jgi:hypothetical protein
MVWNGVFGGICGGFNMCFLRKGLFRKVVIDKLV